MAAINFAHGIGRRIAFVAAMMLLFPFLINGNPGG